MTDKRTPQTRWYTDGADLVGRTKGAPDERFPLDALPDWLRIDGYAFLRRRGWSHDYMLHAVGPDRTLPATKAVRTPRATGSAKPVREIVKWRTAIMHTLTANENWSPVAAQRFAKELPRSEVKSYSTHTDVMLAYAKLYPSAHKLSGATNKEAAD